MLGKHFTIWTNPRGFSHIRFLTEQSVLFVKGFVVDDILELQSSRAQQDLQCLSDTELNQRHYFDLPVPSLVLQLQVHLFALVYRHELQVAWIEQLLVKEVKQGHHRGVVANDKVNGGQITLPINADALPGVMICTFGYLFLLQNSAGS